MVKAVCLTVTCHHVWRAIVKKQMDVSRSVLWNQMIIKKYFEEPWPGHSQFQCDIACAYSCIYPSTAAIMAYSLVGVCTVLGTCINKWCRSYNGRLMETLQKSSEHISVGWRRSWKSITNSRACFSTRRELILCSFEQKLALLCTVCLA
jgi:hypothetical protein